MIRIDGQNDFNTFFNVVAFTIKVGQLNVLSACFPQCKRERAYANGFCALNKCLVKP